MVWDFIKAISKFVYDGTSVEKVDFITRMAICNSCEHLQRKGKLSCQCDVCKCFIEAKARFPAESCPLNKWTAIPGKEKCGHCGG